jgi:hypothetical protein
MIEYMKTYTWLTNYIASDIEMLFVNCVKKSMDQSIKIFVDQRWYNI